MTATFDVALTKKNFSTNTDPSRKSKTNIQIKQLVGGDLEQCSEGEFVSGTGSGLVSVVQLSFAEHRHLILDPDSIWLTIERGMAAHITENAEKLRSKFVNFDGKKTIDVRRDSFVKGGNNHWEGCFDEFSEKIGKEIGPQKDLIVGNFSTTGILERVSSEIVFMDAMSKYFNYSCTTLCGIPSITLEGTVEDWELIRDKTKQLAQYNLDWWTIKLDPVLEKIVDSAKGNVDTDFWMNFYSEGGGSGGPFINGHVIKFYPYLIDTNNEYYQNKYVCFDNVKSFGGGLTINEFPKGISTVPFIWNYYDKQYPMEFIGGIVGSKEISGAVKPGFGWAVRDASIPLLNYPMERLVMDMKICDKNGNVGLLKKAIKEERGNGGERLSDLEILWPEKGLIKYVYHELHEFFVKDVV